MIKCEVCGTVCDENAIICNGCLQPLNKHQSVLNNDTNVIKDDSSNIINDSNSNVVENRTINDINNYEPNESEKFDRTINIPEKSNISIIFDLLFTTILYSIIITFVLGIPAGIIGNMCEIDIRSNLIYQIISIVLTFMLSINSVFKKKIPYKESVNSLIVTCFIMILLFEFTIRYFAINVYGLYDQIYSIAIGCLMATDIMVNYMKKVIDEKRRQQNDSNILFVINIITIVAIIVVLVLGLLSR